MPQVKIRFVKDTARSVGNELMDQQLVPSQTVAVAAPTADEGRRIKLLRDACLTIRSRFDQGQYLEAVSLLNKVVTNEEYPPSVRKKLKVAQQSLLAFASTNFDKGSKSEVYEILLSTFRGATQLHRVLSKDARMKEKTVEGEKDPVYQRATKFASPNSPAATKLKRDLNSKGIAIGKAPMVFIMKGMIDIKQVEQSFRAQQLGSALILENIVVLGANMDKFEEYVSITEQKEGTPAKNRPKGKKPSDFVYMSAVNYAKQARIKAQIIMLTARWEGALWAAIVPDSDIKLLARASSGGRFNYLSCGLGYQDINSIK